MPTSTLIPEDTATSLLDEEFTLDFSKVDSITDRTADRMVPATTTRKRWRDRRGPALAIVAFLLLVAAVPAIANHKAPFSGPNHEYGARVSYDLTFPVMGENRYGDSFWAARGSGIHHAIDIMADKMTPVLAAHTGTVTMVNGSSNSSWSGRCCTLHITGNDGWESVYIHLNNDTPGTDDGNGWGIAPGIELGTRVNAGDVIGWVGDSGNAEGGASHLHFELIDPDGVYVNPYNSLKAAEGDFVATCAAVDAISLGALNQASGLLKEGARGAAIRELQAFLNTLGFAAGPNDGVMGPLTVSAVEDFQASQGLTADGIVGPATRSEISSLASVIPALPGLDSNGRTIRPGYRGEDVKHIQELLAVAGFDAGPADGIYGPKTETAISSFQRLYGGLAVDGKVGPNTRSALADYLGLGDFRACG
jgi:peptidoglycan hydrolase-like protein with peptidoglycan-binding domain